MGGWNNKQDFTPLVRMGETVVRLSKIALFKRLQTIEPELKKAGLDLDLKEMFKVDITKDLRKEFAVAESTSTNSYVSVVETSNSKF